MAPMVLPLARAWPLCRCNHSRIAHGNQHGVCEHCNECDAYQPLLDVHQRPTVSRLLADVSAGLAVLRTNGVEITDAQIAERAANIVMGLLGNYTITGMAP